MLGGRSPSNLVCSTLGIFAEYPCASIGCRVLGGRSPSNLGTEEQWNSCFLKFTYARTCNKF